MKKINDNRTPKQKKFDKSLSAKINSELFGTKPKKRVYTKNLDSYKCQSCGAKFDKEITDEIGRTEHCGKPLKLKKGYILS